jgi:hypothetical protein
MMRDFITPDWKKLITYLLFVILFMGETLVLRSVYQRDYVITFLLNIYNNFFNQIDYVNLFTISFIYYIIVLMILYVLSCLVILILGRVKK